MRTHYCGDINETLLDANVGLYGWVHRVRNLGGIIFVDLRDRKGLVQIIVDPENTELANTATKLHNEYVIYVGGKVRLRPEGLINHELKSGKIEVAAVALKIISTSEPLPFQINEQQEANEDLRLQYRYLDLRRPQMAKNLILRARITGEIRKFLEQKDFIEVETPILTKSTPEGARDYLVPSRVHKGEFYALPQSPQIFKQLLMVAGFDRYYQIARCLRDEDLRADRQPEFTQLDVEMSFSSAREIQNLHENLMCHLFKEILDVNLPNPFPRLTYQEAVLKYGSDKPDLRIPLELVEIKDLVKDSEFSVFANAANSNDGRVVVLSVPSANTLSRKQIDNYTQFANEHGLKNLGYLKVNDRSTGLNGVQSSLLKFLNETVVLQILERTHATTGDMLFFAAGNTKTINTAMGALRIKLGFDLNMVQENSWQPLWVTDFPLFESQDGAWTSTHHPFTAPINEDPKELLKTPGSALAQAYDMVLNGSELGGGSIRICNLELQRAVFKILGLSIELAEAQFGHLLNSFKYGYPRHGGIAFGLDRIVMLMAGAKSIRDVIPFPKTLNAQCPLTQAPSKVSDAQLEELGIAVTK